MNIIKSAFLILSLMTSVTAAWAVDVTTEAELKDAVKDVSEPTITLADNIALTGTLTIKRNLTLDLNGHSITANGFRAIHITSGENVVITSETPALISVGGSIAENSSVIRIGDDSGDERNVKLTLNNNVTVSTAKCYGITVFGSKTKESLIVKGAVATTDVVASAISGNGNDVNTGTEITINETAVISSTNDVAIYHPQVGTLTVNGTVTGAGGIEIKAGKLIVGDDAKITATGAISHITNNDGTSTRGYAIAIVENEKYAGVSTVTISDEAKITGPVANLQDSHNDNHHPDFSRSEVKMVVEVAGGKQFTTLADAMNDVEADGMLKILEPIALKRTIEIDKNLNIDLNGKNITATNAGAFWIKEGTVNFTGTGTIALENSTDNDQAVIRVGDDVAEEVSLTIGSDVVVNAAECYGIKLTGTNTESLTVEGKVNTQNRPAIYAGGNDQTITVSNGAVITTTEEVAIYQPMPGTLAINGTVTGASAVELKAGTLSVGATANLNATAPVAHTPNDNGTSSRGYAIAAVENKNNAGNISVTVADGATLDANDPIASLWDSEYTNSATKPTFSENVKMVAAIEKDLYHKLPHAIAFVPSNGTVRLLGDMTLSETLVMSREITSSLDLDGHTLTGSGCTAVTVKGGHVTITSSAETPRASITSDASTTVIQLGDNTGDKRATSLTIRDKVDITTTTANGINVAGSKTRESLTVYGNVTTTGKPAIIGSGDAEKGGTTITIAPSSTITTSDNVAIYHPQSGELVIDGKVIGTGTTAGAIEMKGGDLTVAAGSTVTAAGTAVHNPDPIPTLSNDVPSTNGYAIAIVENANFTGVGKVFIEKTATVTGVIATLIDSENNNVAEPEFNGDIYMLAEVMKTETRGEKYSTLADAVAAAAEGKTVRLLDYITLTEALTIDKNITLNFDVYDITGNQASGAVLAVSNGATLKNGGINTTMQGIEITDGTVNLQQLEIKADAGSLVVRGGTVTADKASTFTSSSANTMAISNGAVVTINGKVENTGANAAIAATGLKTTTALTVKNGATVTSSGKGIDWESAGTLTIEGGKVTGADAVYASAGTITINAGTFTGTGTGYAVNIVGSTCNPTVKNGTFYCEDAANPIVADNAIGFVEGDYFSKTIAQALCATGYRISESKNNNGMFYLISELVITDATVWNPQTNYIIHTAKYIRNSGMGTTKFGTLCLPFAFTPGGSGTTISEEMTFYSVNRIEGSTLWLDALSGTIAAGTPVIFQRTGSNLGTSFTIECEDAYINKDVVAKADNGLVGTFATNTTVTGGALETAYYLNGDHFHQADEEIIVPAFRAYIVYPSPDPARPDVLNIFIDGETEDLQSIMQESAEEMIFDLQGNRQEELKPGMNIVKMSDGRTIKVYVNK